MLSLSSFIKSLDSFGTTSTFSINATSKFNTVMGGILTVFCTIIVMAYAGFLLNDLTF